MTQVIRRRHGLQSARRRGSSKKGWRCSSDASTPSQSRSANWASSQSGGWLSEIIHALRFRLVRVRHVENENLLLEDIVGCLLELQRRTGFTLEKVERVAMRLVVAGEALGELQGFPVRCLIALSIPSRELCDRPLVEIS